MQPFDWTVPMLLGMAMVMQTLRIVLILERRRLLQESIEVGDYLR
jgi:hypothetical protein